MDEVRVLSVVLTYSQQDPVRLWRIPLPHRHRHRSLDCWRDPYQVVLEPCWAAYVSCLLPTTLRHRSKADK